MSLYVAVVLLGQVGNSAEDGPSPVNAAAPAAVRFADQDESPAAAFRSAAPLRPDVQAPARPALRTSVGDSATLNTVPAIRAQQSAEMAVPAVAAAPPTGNSQELQVAATIMQEILVPDEQAQQSVRRVRLVETLSRLGEPGLQSAAIRAYWDLAQTIATARFAADKVRVLAEVAVPTDETDRVLLTEARADAEAEEAAAHDALLAAQYGLLRITSMPFEDVLPWPADAPLVAPYRTQFATIFANQSAPLSLRQIHQSLPGKLTLIEKRVSAMAAAENAADILLETYKRGGISLVQLLATIDRLERSRRAFLNAVVDYNYQIAEYSLAVVGSGIGSETLVATLIKISAANGSLVEIPRDVRQAGALAPVREGEQFGKSFKR